MYAVIDIGSNKVRMVLYKLSAAGQLTPVVNCKEAVALMGYIGLDNTMSEKGIIRISEILKRFLQIIENTGVSDFFTFATASIRNAANSLQIVRQIKENSGVTVQLLTAEEEALYDYYGIIGTLKETEGIIADIGGRSTEIVLFKEKKQVSACAIPVGSLNMYTSYVNDIIPAAGELSRITDIALEFLKKNASPKSDTDTKILCGVGGTARAFLKLNRELFDTGIQEKTPVERIHRILNLAEKNRDILSSAIIGAAPDRIHTLLPGLAILRAVCGFYGCEEIVVSSSGVREGFLLSRIKGGVSSEI